MIAPKSKSEEYKFDPQYNLGYNGIIVYGGYLTHKKYIGTKDIDKINKIVGIDNFVVVPGDQGSGGLPEEIFIDIMIGLFTAGLSDLIIIALKSIFNRFKRNIKPNKRGNMVFRFGDKDAGYSIEFKADLSGDADQINSIVEKVSKLAEIVTKDTDEKRVDRDEN